MIDSLIQAITNPVVILVIGVVTVIGMIIVLRVNAFIALITAAILVSLLSPGAWAGKIERVAEAFGTTTYNIGIVIAMAAVIGKCLMDSGAADRIVRSFLKLLGEKRAATALMGSGFVLAMPVFFDTVFYLLVPLARSLWKRTRRNYVLYITAIACGGAITHTLVPPTPGPLVMASTLDIDVGVMIMVGTLIGLPTALVGLLVCRAMNRLMSISMRPYGGEPEPEPLEDSQLPGLVISLAPVLLPVLLISASTVTDTIAEAEHTRLLEAGEVLDWPGFSAQLSTAGTDKETEPVRRVMELLPADLRRDVVGIRHTDAPEPALSARVKTHTQALVRQRNFYGDKAFLGVALAKQAQNLLERGVSKLPKPEIDRFRRVYRDKAFAGTATSAPAQKLLDRALGQLSPQEIQRLNWLMLEAAFPGQVKQTTWRHVANLAATFGNANLALLLSAAIAMVVLLRKRRLTLGQLAKTTETALMSGGVIILITAGGGAFGAMLRQCGVKESIENFVRTDAQSAGQMTLAMLLLGYAIATVMKIAQGSGTVSMITTSAIMASMGVTSGMLGCHPVYLACAIGAGSLTGSWMNDSGFWIYARMSVLTEVEALKSWTILLAILGVTALGFTLLAVQIYPMAP
jgi:GntP family gluconate:H+ symporter